MKDQDLDQSIIDDNKEGWERNMKNRNSVEFTNFMNDDYRKMLTHRISVHQKIETSMKEKGTITLKMGDENHVGLFKNWLRDIARNFKFKERVKVKAKSNHLKMKSMVRIEFGYVPDKIMLWNRIIMNSGEIIDRANIELN